MKRLKNTLLDIIKSEKEDLIQLWIKSFENEEKDEEYRYYDDFLGFFEECVLSDLDLRSDEVEALKLFLNKLIEIKGEDKFFNFRNSIYSCYLKFPILKKLEDKNLFDYEDISIITQFFEGITSKLIVDFVEKTKEIRRHILDELEEREAPISQIWHNTLMVSIVGTLDSNRVLKIMDKILNALEKRDIEYVIIDIGTINDMNSEVARQLIKLNSAIHYMGAKAYLTGITPVIAKSLTHLDINLGDIKTFSTTQKAMEVIIGKFV